eukprot:3097751-Alexandrium_andersonii.AAC.1
MSASLVGSEMCIRDRPSLVPLEKRLNVIGAMSPIPDSCIPPRRGDPSAVSYTHLTLPTICSV